jgi:secreted Zn-dependent insulinase-like peptidase
LEHNFFDENGAPTDYLSKIYSERQEISKMTFKYKDDLDDIYFLSNSLNENKLEDILSGDIILNQFDAESIKHYLNMLASVENLIIIVGDCDYHY